MDSLTDRILTLEELARFLRISIRTVYELAKDGELPGRRIGRQWRFDRDRVLEWLNVRGKPDRARGRPTPQDHGVLIVDDDELLLQAYEEALADHFGRETVRTASNGLEALVEIARRVPAVVIADITLPRVDGLELCRILKCDPDLSAILVALISGTPETELTDQVHECRADMFIRKPLGGKALCEVVGRLLNIRPEGPGGSRAQRRSPPTVVPVG